jgi:hypothetical protein
MTPGTEPIPPSALQRLGAQLAELLDDDHWNNIESNYLLPALKELEQAKRDALPCQVIDVLDHNQKLVAALTESHALNVNWVSVAEPEMLAHLSEYEAVIAQGAAALNIR